MSPSDALLCQQKEKYSQTFDEAHVSQVLSLIDERERWREGKGREQERKRKENAEQAFCVVLRHDINRVIPVDFSYFYLFYFFYSCKE